MLFRSAGEAGDPYWVSVDNLWQRYVSRTFADQDLQGVVEISGYQECREPGIATFTGLGLDVAVVDEDLSVEAARALRLAFSEIAEITAGPRSIFDMDGAQALAIANIVAILEATELEVETLARVATALGVRASDLLRPISTEEN